MKKTIVLIVLFIGGLLSVQAQNIVDIFYLLPKEYLDNLDKEQQQQLIKDNTLAVDDLEYSVAVDTKNGFMRMSYNYTEGQSGYGVYQIAYWNLADSKLIAVSTKNGSNGGFFQSEFNFFVLKDKEITLAENNIISGYSSDTEQTMLGLLDSFVKPELTIQQREDLRYDEFTIELPQQGTDIYIGFSEQAAERHIDKLYKTQAYYYFDRKTGRFEER